MEVFICTLMLGAFIAVIAAMIMAQIKKRCNIIMDMLNHIILFKYSARKSEE